MYAVDHSRRRSDVKRTCGNLASGLALLIVCFNVAGTVHAGLLAEVTFRTADNDFGSPPPQSLFSSVAFRIGGIVPYTLFQRNIGPADVGTTISIPDPPASTMYELLQDPDVQLSTTTNSNDGDGNLGVILDNGWFYGPVTRVSPKLGPGLVGYDVQDITVTVDRFSSVENRFDPTRYVWEAWHTIRFYGDPIPEPATAWLAIAALLVFAGYRRTCCRERN